MEQVAKRGILAIGLAVSCLSPSIATAAIQWTGNNHWYEAVYVPGGISWQDAANAATVGGGYLVSINSVEENSFVYSLVGSLPRQRLDIGPWLGAYQDASAITRSEGWRWVSGEPFTYSRWGDLEPNDGVEDNIENHREDFLSYHFEVDGYWNDLPVDGTEGVRVESFAIEYLTNPSPVPDASTVWMLLVGLLPIIHRSSKRAIS